MEVHSKKMKTPVGELTLVANDLGLLAVLWENDRPNRVRLPWLDAKKGSDHPILMSVQEQLSDYFSGDRKKFEIPLSFQGTEFQMRVWSALQEIPFGETLSYSELAKRIGHPKACRAVGGANGRNPISIIVPCHRVIGARGELTGFAGGFANKSYLLNFELGRS